MNAEALLDQQAFIRGLAASLTFANEDPDDVVQETWLAAVRNPPEDGPGVRGWLATVVKNALRQSRRSGARRVAREALAAAPKAVPTPDEIREREAVRREVVEAVLDLDEPYRTAVLLRYYEELPPRKIAERTGDPVETVKTRLVRARGMLRERLDDHHDGDGRSWGFAVAGLALWPGERTPPAPTAGRTLPWGKMAAGVVIATVVAVIGVTTLSFPTAQNPPDRAAAMEDGVIMPAGDPGGAGAPALPTGAGEPKHEGEAPGASGGEEETGGPAGPDAKTSAAIEGTVRDQKTGKPMSDAPVRLVAFADPVQHSDTRTDAKGDYRFSNVPAGVKVRVFIRGRRGRVVSAGRPAGDRVLEKGRTVRWDLAARRREGVDLRVRLSRPQGVALPAEMRITLESRYEANHAVDHVKAVVDPATGALTLFLARGTHTLAFEATGLTGSLGPIVVEGDGPARDITLELHRRGGLRLRLVDGAGRPLRRGPIGITVFMRTEQRDPIGSVSVSLDGLGRHETDERGELDLTGILPALGGESNSVTRFSFAVDAEGVFRGTGQVPNWEITKKEILERRDSGGGDVTLDLPALPRKTMRTFVTTPQGEPVAGVRVDCEPAEYFEEKEVVSDAGGRLEFRLRKVPPFPPRKPEDRVTLRLVARAPWLGRVTLWMLTSPRQTGGPPVGLKVSRAREIRLKLIDDTGKPVAHVDVKVGAATVKTDVSGQVGVEIAEGREKVTVRAVGHLSEDVLLKGVDGESVVRLHRARKVVVSFRGPDGNGIVPVIAREKGSGRFFPVVRHDQNAKTLTFLLPLRPITISVHPTCTKYTGSVVAEPEAREVELAYRTP